MQTPALVQMFNLPFRTVQRMVPRLHALGVSHVIVSPPQKSNASRSWWGRYQPVDYQVIEGPLGGRKELEELCWIAGERGLRVMVDAVLNHMSNEPHHVRIARGRIVEARFPRFSTPDFHARLDGSHGKGRGLAHLRTDSPYVRHELADYLRMLYSVGVRGFRFDAAKHIDAGFFAHVLRGLPPVLCFGEMVYTKATDFHSAYFHLMKAWDFPLAHTLKSAFALGGDLGSLIDPASRGDALWGPLAVTFVNHHDLVKNRKRFDDFRIDNAQDRLLGYVYILARQDGIPCVYAGDLRSKYVTAGLKFHRLADGQPTRWLHASRNELMFSRGPQLLAAVNKAGSSWAPGPWPCGLAPGRYRDLLSRTRHTVDHAGRWLECRVPARGAVLLVHGDRFAR